MKEKIFRKKNVFPKILNFGLKLIYIIGVILLGIIISKGWANWEKSILPPIDRIASWSQVVIAYAAIFAIFQFAAAYSEIDDRKTKTVLGFVAFFRESVIGSADKIR